MKTPIQELIETFEEMRSPIDSKVDVDFAISLMKSMLEKEKEVMCEFALKYAQADRKEPCETSTQLVFDETFNTKER